MGIRQALIVEDQFDICYLLEQILLIKNIPSLKVSSISEAFKTLEENCPSFIFIDHKLPDGWGFEIIPKFRELCPTSKIIAMSGQYEFIKGWASCETADFFMVKPFEVKKIIDFLEQFEQ